MKELGKGVRIRIRLIGVDPGLLRFAAGVDLHEKLQGLGLLVPCR